MKYTLFTEFQIVIILMQQEAGAEVMAICREHGTSEASFYNRKAKDGGMAPPLVRRLKEPEIKRELADLMML